jgi:imidazolonepropionase-like amidohydrolase
MRKILALLGIVFLSGSLSAQTTITPPERPLVLMHITVIDATGAASRPDMTVKGNRIAAVGRTGRVRVPPDAQVIHAGGKFLIPGL